MAVRRPAGTPSDAPSGTPTGAPPAGGGGGGGVHEEPTDDSRYLRGTWRTDKQGFVTFKTVFPGWYQGRCVHIHTKVHVNGEWTDAGYEGGTTCHTGQFFFDEESVLASAEVEPYSTSTTERTTLDEDTIYDQSGTTGGLLKLKYNKKDIAKGVVGSITVGVDPEATHDGTDDAVQPGCVRVRADDGHGFALPLPLPRADGRTAREGRPARNLFPQVPGRPWCPPTSPRTA